MGEKPVSEEQGSGVTTAGDISGLIPGHITTKQELNVWESRNILDAVKKNLSKRTGFKIDEARLKKLHRDMFNRTWKWAGKYRASHVNIGIAPGHIPVEVRKLCDDAAYWDAHNVYDEYECSARIHHRLVKIHPFYNGNGRHARLAADIYLYNKNKKLPVWPGAEIIKPVGFRERYIKALQDADNGDYKGIISITRELTGSG